MHKRYENTVWLVLVMAIFVGVLTTLTYTPTTALAVVDMAELEALDYPALITVAEADDVETVEEDPPDEYDGEIVVATGEEVITMTIVDGVKTFTNHLLG